MRPCRQGGCNSRARRCANWFAAIEHFVATIGLATSLLDQSSGADEDFQLLGVCRLYQVMIESNSSAMLLRFVIAVGSYRNEQRSALHGAKCSRHLVTIFLRQADVADDDIGR